MRSKVTPNDILDVVANYLNEALTGGIITLQSTGNPQGDSLANERVIGNSLRAFTLGHPLFRQFNLFLEVSSSPKSWCDFVIRSETSDIWLPINLKVSSFTGRDDISSKEGLFYALTGINPQAVNILSWERFFERLASSIRWSNCTADYYLLVVRKQPGEMDAAFWTSLLRLNSVHPNGSRPPYQANWQENRTWSDRTRQEAILYLLGVLRETMALRSAAERSYQRHLEPLLYALDRSPRESLEILTAGILSEPISDQSMLLR